MEGLNLDTIINGGLAGICVLVIMAMIYIFKTQNKTINNHLSHSTDAIENNNKIVGATMEVIKANTKVLDRVDRK